MAVQRAKERIDGLSELRNGAPEQAIPALRKALNDRVNLVVAKAAKIAAEREFRALVPDLLQAYSRMFEDAVKRDPQCWAKTAIAGALKDLGHAESPPFLLGLKHRQMEPVWGGEVDTAENLRGTCLLALVACDDLERGQALHAFVDALSETAHTIRIEAARALGQMSGEESALVLRLKARLGDERPEVTGQVFDSILAIEGEQALPFLAEFLNGGGDAANEAALALGASRLAGGFDVLRQAWEKTHNAELKAVILRAASLSRLEPAIAWLIDLIRTGRKSDAADAIDALALHGDSEEVRNQIAGVVEGRGPELRMEFRKRFTRKT